MSQPLEEIPTERLLEELLSRTGGLEALEELIELKKNENTGGEKETENERAG